MAIISDIPITISIRQQVVKKIKILLENYFKTRSIALTIRELNKLSDRDLTDIGIHRSEIIAKARLANNQK
ncbi:MAG: hypothetical protein CMA31_00220 [Euryarchaeota archaeon]|nr:hypothetical protein [Euryarchaeota archaeon]|tara:strand:+ start:948 stop:1160 length:213 start_codon:yes stop_codon:yes gene_type:complete